MASVHVAERVRAKGLQVRSGKCVVDDLADGFRAFPMAALKTLSPETRIGVGSRCGGWEKWIVRAGKCRFIKVVDPFAQNSFGFFETSCKECTYTTAKFCCEFAWVLAHGLLLKINCLTPARSARSQQGY